MAEYVEQSLEKLLPLFEQLKNVKLLTGGEVTVFIKRCRRLDYRCTKLNKNPNDFFNYTSYLEDMLRLINKRREIRNYQLKYDQINGPLQGKIAELYTRICSRFPGRLNFFQKQVRFLKEYNMYGVLSRAYSRALQFHGKNVALREEAARFEFFTNNSPENARSQLQLSLRSSPQEVRLWAALYDIEINYVKRLFERRQMLLKKEEDGGPTPDSAAIAAELASIQDAVFQFKLAEIVRDQALRTLETEDLKNEFLFKCWDFALKCGNVAVQLSDDLYKRLEESKSEYFYMTKVRAAELEEADVCNAYEQCIKELPTEKMYRLFIQYCLERIKNNDPYAKMRLGSLILSLEEMDCGEQSEFEKWIPIASLSSLQKQTLTKKLLVKYPSSSLLWQIRLAHIVHLAEKTFHTIEDEEAANKEVDEVQELFNTAHSQLHPDKHLPIWQLAVDYTLITDPEDVDTIFERAFLEARPCVSAPLKSDRLRYLGVMHPHDPEVVRKEYKRLAAMVPTSVRFHINFIVSELARGAETNHKAISEAFELCVAEFGYSEVDCWIAYAKYAMKNKPELMPKIKTRAEVALPKSKINNFEAKWSLVIQGR
uniref:U3 small nucleolar RNA-associated protein 6 homolog n=1 Tax=Steinernema glaseri TaxID=37863 RepID=A0A1I8APS5_9BILA